MEKKKSFTRSIAACQLAEMWNSCSSKETTSEAAASTVILTWLVFGQSTTVVIQDPESSE